MKHPDPCVLGLLGVTGDLSKRKLIPALFDLYLKDHLPRPFQVLGLGRGHMDDAGMQSLAREALAQFSAHAGTPEQRDAFATLFSYQEVDTGDADAYGPVAQRLEQVFQQQGIPHNILFYLALPPKMYTPAIQGLKRSGLSRQDQGGWRRIVVEKPFGTDLASARALNALLLRAFGETHVFRIDHYLGKETVQNILALRFANGIFEPLWNRNQVHHLEVSAAESIGVGGRGGYFDGVGILRDMVQNHLLQVLATVTMEPPGSFDATSVRNETAKVLNALRPIAGQDVSRHVVRGQYTGATVRGERLPGYREESGVSADSRTETYVALRAHIDNWRWGGVPIYIRSGKRLPTRVTEVVVHFREPPHQFFHRPEGEEQAANRLILRIQPDEGILLQFGLKVPAAGFQICPVGMDFHYASLGTGALPDAYERLLLDGLLGDATLFARSDAVEQGWAFVEPILAAWQERDDAPLLGYPAGTWGPRETSRLFDAGQDFRQPCRNLNADGGYCEL
ncbi:MAG: glucose-6-phosphate dehydrogenase [Magnetococcus sp. WYHC-3]